MYFHILKSIKKVTISFLSQVKWGTIVIFVTLFILTEILFYQPAVPPLSPAPGPKHNRNRVPQRDFSRDFFPTPPRSTGWYWYQFIGKWGLLQEFPLSHASDGGGAERPGRCSVLSLVIYLFWKINRTLSVLAAIVFDVLLSMGFRFAPNGLMARRMKCLICFVSAPDAGWFSFVPVLCFTCRFLMHIPVCMIGFLFLLFG